MRSKGSKIDPIALKYLFLFLARLDKLDINVAKLKQPNVRKAVTS